MLGLLGNLPGLPKIFRVGLFGVRGAPRGSSGAKFGLKLLSGISSISIFVKLNVSGMFLPFLRIDSCSACVRFNTRERCFKVLRGALGSGDILIRHTI